jgi:cell division transport system permease protein
LTALRNVLSLVISDALSAWRRDFRSFAPALGAMTLLLTFTGVAGILAYTGTRLVQSQARDAAVLHAYLASSDESSVQGLEQTLRSDPRVISVTFVSPDEALQQAQSEGLGELAGATGSNPFPASLNVQVRSIQDLAGVDSLVRKDAELDPQLQTSYDAGAYNRLGQLIFALSVGGVVLLGLLAAVALGITGASVRGVVVSRREELRALDLLGSPGWILRAPFVTQGMLTGLLAGIFAGICVLGVYSSEAQAARTTLIQWLPSVATETTLLAAGLLAAGGMALGALASVTELRRL